MLIIAVVSALGMLGYVIAAPRMEGKFTEFYILGGGGKAVDYPKELIVGGGGRVTVGIINREQEPATYRMEVVVDGDRESEVSLIELEHEEKWEGAVTFSLSEPGENTKVEFLLYKGNQSEVYKSLHLWIDVKG